MIYVSATNRKLTEKYVDWAVQGLPDAKKLEPIEIINKTDCTKAVMFGVLRGTHLVYKWAEKNKIDFYYMDRPYWGETRNAPFYTRIVKNNHLKSWQENRPDDRFKNSFPWPINPWKKYGKNIIVCPPTNAIKKFFGVHDWLDKTLKILKTHTDRPIIVKNKGYNPIIGLDKKGGYMVTGNDHSKPSGPIDWDNAYAIVTFNSNITLEATTRGIPCFTDTHNACAPISETDFTKIETPKYLDREPLYYSMAYGQFTAEEIKNGYAWKTLDES
jgi:hypothetical protein|tara:strand:- start:12369 stop:13184 length:816 start_codon:yes stop_codon:yes gene_type:complete